MSKQKRPSRKKSSRASTKNVRKSAQSPKNKEMAKFRKQWDLEKPRGSKVRRIQKDKCEKEGKSPDVCFLGGYPHYPICKKNTCTVSRAGIAVAQDVAERWKRSPKASAAKRARRVLRYTPPR